MASKTVSVHLTLSVEDHATLKERAKAAHFDSILDYIRHCVFQNPNAGLVFEMQQLTVAMKQNEVVPEEKVAEILARAFKALEK